MRPSGARPPLFGHLSLVLGPDHAPLSKRHGATSVAEFRERGYLPEALVNYLALLGWSPGEGEELVAASEMARRFDLTKVSHSAAVFDTDKLAWINRHYMKAAEPGRLVRESSRFFLRAGYLTEVTPTSSAFLESLLPLVVGSVDRLEEMPARVSFLFDWHAADAARLVAAEPDGAKAVEALAAEIGDAPLLDREAFRAAAQRARERSGLKGKALFHPIRVALTGAESGPELDLAVPAIDRGAAIGPGEGLRAIIGCAARLRALALRRGTPVGDEP